MAKIRFTLSDPTLLSDAELRYYDSEYDGPSRLITISAKQASLGNLHAAVASGDMSSLNTISLDGAIYGTPPGGSGRFLLDQVAGIVDSSGGAEGENQAVAFTTPLVSPGAEIHDGFNPLKVVHTYAIANSGNNPHAALSSYGSKELTDNAGWRLVDGAANTTFDLRNLVSKSSVLVEQTLGWDFVGASPFATYNRATNGFDINESKDGYLGTLRVGDPGYGLTQGSGAPAVFGIYSRTPASVINYEVEGNAGADRVIAGLAAFSFDGGADVDTADYASIGNRGNGSAIVVRGANEAGSYSVQKNLVDEAILTESSVLVPLGERQLTTERGIFLENVGRMSVTDSLRNVEKIIGSAGDDKFYGSALADDFDGGGGDDLIVAGGGADTIHASIGNDTVRASGTDTLVDYGSLQKSITVNVAVVKNVITATVAKASGTDRLLDNAVLWGTAFDDQMNSSAPGSVLNGRGGNDHMSASGRSVVLHGGDGDDVLVGNGNLEVLWGDAGDDQIQANGANTTVRGGAGNDVLTAQGDDAGLFGDEGDDILNGSAGKNTYLDGGAGNNRVVSHGQSTIYGDIGNSTLVGSVAKEIFNFNTSTHHDRIEAITQPSLYGSWINNLDDVVNFAGIDYRSIAFQRSGNDLFVHVLGTDTEVTVAGWFLSELMGGPVSTIGKFVAPGNTGAMRELSYGDVAAVVGVQANEGMEAWAGYANGYWRLA